MKTFFLYIFCVVLIAALACSSTSFPAPDPTAVPPMPQSVLPTEVVFTPIPTLTAVAPTSMPSPLSQSLVLQSSPFNETGNGPVYAITAQVPFLQGSDDPRIVGFNIRLSELVQNEVNQFRSEILANQPVVPIMAGSSLDVKYTLIGQRGEIWSLKFDLYFYYDGAAHPGSYSITSNYDLEHGREITLDELFLPNSNHLQVIADYCNVQLSTRDIGFDMFQNGADPLPENYQRWNLSDEGFVITFDEYQVAPYAAGPQTVIAPFSELQSIINPQGALVSFK